MGVDTDAKENVGNKQPDPMGMLLKAQRETASMATYCKQKIEQPMDIKPMPDPMSLLLEANKETLEFCGETAAKQIACRIEEEEKQVLDSFKIALQAQNEEDEMSVQIAKQFEDDLALAKQAQEEEEKNAALEAENRKRQLHQDEKVATQMHEDLVKQLQQAVSSGNEGSLKQLIEQGVDLSLTSQTGEALTPVHLAVQKGKKDILKLLIAQKAPLDQKDSRGATPLHLACETNRMDAVTSLVESGAMVNAEDNHGRTPVMAAAKAGHFAPIKFLVTKGANLYHKDKDNKMALQIVPFLSRTTKSTLEEMCGWGLLSASAKGKAKEVSRLLERGASLRLSDEHNRTALHHAAANGQLAVVKKLLEHRANSNAGDIRMQTPLHLAAQGSHDEVLAALLAAGAGLDAVDVDGKTARELAPASSKARSLLGGEA